MNDNWLVQKSQIKEEPLQSSAPVVGSLIAALRNAWGSVAAKWMIHDVVQQQNEFNKLMALHIQTLDERLIEQDHELVSLTHQMAELNVTMGQLQKQIERVDAQLAQFEDTK